MKTETLERLIKIGVPIIGIESLDYNATINSIIAAVSQRRSIVVWDMLKGAVAANKGSLECASYLNGGDPPHETTARIEALLSAAESCLSRMSILIIQDAHMFLESQDTITKCLVIQGIRNLRDHFKASQKTVILLAPSFRLPVELINDVEIITEEPPSDEELASIAAGIYQSAGLPKPEIKVFRQITEALRGVTAFAAENAVAKALTKEGVNIQALWETKRRYIKQNGALHCPATESSFATLGGLSAIKEYGRAIIQGKNCPSIVVLLDEIDKWIVSLSDSNGINADALGQLLSAMQDNEWDGITLPGFPGTGKTEWAKALGNEAGGMFLQLDLGGAKGSLVGESERMIRQAISLLKAMGGDKVFFVATCNDMNILMRKPELLRRLSYGIYFFDLPKKEDQAPIWKLYMQKYSVSSKLPPCDGWTGAEIKKVCKLADEFGISLTEAAKKITPVIHTMGDSVDALRRQAEKGGWICASTGLPYSNAVIPARKARRITTN